jgi:uncharacterized membrane protein YeaQ/YmgE (transglycosylase-associated protein family)
MHLSNQSLLVIIVVGIVAGYLAGRVMEGGGFGWIVALIVNAFIGAIVLLLLLRLIGGGGGYYGRRWGRRRI